MAVSVNDLLGNRFELLQDVKVYQGSPSSGQVETWSKGRRTPTIYSWVEREGNIWYQFDQVNKQYFLKHNPDALKVLAERGAAEYLENGGSNSSSTSVAFGAVDSLFNIFKPTNLESTFKWVLGLASIYISWKVYSAFNSGMAKAESAVFKKFK